MPPRKSDRLSKLEIESVRQWILNEKTPQVTQHDIIPLMHLRCTVCHGTRRREAGLDLRTRTSMLKGGKSGPALVLGKPEQSLILKKIHSGAMPPRRQVVAVSVKPMEKHEIELLTRWIQNGAPEVASPSIPFHISEEDRKFWAFQPPRLVKVPHVKGEIANPIDVFIQRKLGQANLSLSPRANRLTLMRRVYLDLIGLPPTSEEIQTYLEDRSPNAVQKLIDRLLADPRYGERWARHWLDLAGYSDSEGVQDSDKLRPHAWRFRDYVIRAFNDDKPYDRFLHEQLAGDELADYRKKITPEIYDNLVATGFLRMAPDGTNEPLTGFLPDRLEMIDDEIEIFSAGVLGMTIKCARCHTHKFDPIPQRDYYRLLAIFKPALDEHNWLSPQRAKEKPGEKDRYLSGDGKTLIRALFSRPEPSPTYVLRRGNYLTPGELVRPGPPMSLTQGKVATFKQSGSRLAFAKWLTRADHPLTARVMVNRIWYHHFGRGLVASLDNFGKAGERPSHPDLLDWLAIRFVKSGWSVKAMHRLMLTSRTYQQSSLVSPSKKKLDPENRLLSRMSLRRMDAEVLRDTLVHLSGRLENRRFGPPDPVEARGDGLVTSKKTSRGWRRSVYVLQRRTQVPTILESFDLPRMSPNCVMRRQSNVVLQPLHLLNNKLVDQWAESFASRLEKGKEIEQAFLMTFSRKPTSEERELCQKQLSKLIEKWGTLGEEKARMRAVKNLCRALLSSAELLYID